MKEVVAYLNFDGTARQAMQFYQQSLGGTLTVNAMPDDKGQPSTDPEARIMHSELALNGQPVLMASDAPPAHKVTMGDNCSVAIQCDSVEEIDRFFAALSKNGKVSQPLIDAPWGARFGMLTDQFGIHWLLNCQLATQKS